MKYFIKTFGCQQNTADSERIEQAFLARNYKKAKSCFLKAISLNPDNLDNWIDLAFALRHNGEYEISNGILFNYNYIIHYYKYLKLTDRNYLTLKKLVLEVVKRTHNA